MSSTIACQAATPLIDLERSGAPFWQYKKASPEPFLGGKNTRPIIGADGNYFDFEQEVTNSEYSRSFSKQKKVNFSKSFTAELYNVHTKEVEKFFINRNFNSTKIGWRGFDYFCRDWRRQEYVKMDPNLLMKLLKVMESIAEDGGVVRTNVLSAYRTKQTNEMLRSRSSKVAKNSFHILGKAIDVQIPGISAKKLHEYSKSVSGGGVGVYKTFVHLDTGPDRSWGA
jgi:uncharacterized protein YcbK (DUF882 family)